MGRKAEYALPNVGSDQVTNRLPESYLELKRPDISFHFGHAANPSSNQLKLGIYFRFPRYYKMCRKIGWGGRIRTSACWNQNPESYRLTTPQ